MKLLSKLPRQLLLKPAICLVFSVFFALKGFAGGPPATIIVQPLGLAVQNGGTALLTSTAVSIGSSMTFQWLFNGQPVPTTNTTVVNVVVPLVGTVSTLTVNHVSPASGGNYSVKVTNGSGSVTSNPATLVVLTDTVSNVVTGVVSILSTGTGMTTNGFKLQLSGPAGSNYVIQASADLKNWTSIATNAAPTGSVSYTDTAATNLPVRYYRVKIQ